MLLFFVFLLSYNISKIFYVCTDFDPPQLILSLLTCACSINACVLIVIARCAILLFRSRWTLGRVSRTFTVFLTTSSHNVSISFEADGTNGSVVTCALFTASTGFLTAFNWYTSYKIRPPTSKSPISLSWLPAKSTFFESAVGGTAGIVLMTLHYVIHTTTVTLLVTFNDPITTLLLLRTYILKQLSIATAQNSKIILYNPMPIIIL